MRHVGGDSRGKKRRKEHSCSFKKEIDADSAQCIYIQKRMQQECEGSPLLHTTVRSILHVIDHRHRQFAIHYAGPQQTSPTSLIHPSYAGLDIIAIGRGRPFEARDGRCLPRACDPISGDMGVPRANRPRPTGPFQRDAPTATYDIQVLSCSEIRLFGDMSGEPHAGKGRFCHR